MDVVAEEEAEESICSLQGSSITSAVPKVHMAEAVKMSCKRQRTSPKLEVLFQAQGVSLVKFSSYGCRTEVFALLLAIGRGSPKGHPFSFHVVPHRLSHNIAAHFFKVSKEESVSPFSPLRWRCYIKQYNNRSDYPGI